MKLVFLRHGEREYDNSGLRVRGRVVDYAPRYDAPITEASVSTIESTVGRMLREHGVPEGLIVSPFRRTRETADVAMSLIQTTSTALPRWVAYDARLSEYLGNQGRVNPRNNPEPQSLYHLDTTTRTLYTSPVSVWPMRPDLATRFQRGPMVYETRDEFRDRVADFLYDLAENYQASDYRDAHYDYQGDGENFYQETDDEASGSEWDDPHPEYLLIVSHGFTIAAARSVIEGVTHFEQSIAPGSMWVTEWPN